MAAQDNNQPETQNEAQTEETPQLANQTTLQGGTVVTDGNNNQVNTLMNVQAMINSSLAKIDRAKEELKPVKEMINSYLENDEKYNQLVEVTKKANKAKGARKKELLALENGQELKAKLDTIQEEMSEAREALSYYLREYQRITGANEIETDDGELREIKYSARLVRKTNLNK